MELGWEAFIRNLLRRVMVISAIALLVLSNAVTMQVYEASGAWVGGPVYIRADGSIDPPDAPIVTVDKVTYTLTGNITSSGDGIIVERDNVVIDGAGYTVQGAGADFTTGIFLSYRNNVTIKNINIKNFHYGLYLYYSSNNNISGNNIINGQTGIYLEYSPNNSICGNNLKNNYFGIDLYSSSNNNISGNIFTNCGLFVCYSYENVVVGNTVNGRPLVYLEGASDVAVKDAGQVILVNCNNITVQNLNLSNTTDGIELWNTHNTTISGNNITNNTVGIHLRDSSRNIISGNNLTANECGIKICYNSAWNIISGNNITANGGGVWFWEFTFYNVICGNIIANNNWGIEIPPNSKYNIIYENIIVANNDCGVNLCGSSNNTVSGNNITNNGYYGIYVWGSSNNTVSGNNIESNYYGLFQMYSSDNRFYHNNFVGNALQVYSYDSVNVWDDGYPGGGNYWSDYAGVDYYSGPNQDQPGSDGIGDTPYVIDENNVDRYPLMRPCAPVRATVTFSTNGLDSDASGTILTVDGASYSYTQLPVSFTWDVNSTHSFTWTDYVGAGSGKRFAWVSTSGFSTARSDTIIVPSGGGSVTATYKTQYRWALSQTGIGSDATETIVTVDGSSYGYSNLPQTFWWDSGSSHSYSYQEYVSSSTSGKRYANHNPPSWSGTISGSGSLNPSYHIEYRLTISASSSDAGSTNPAPGSYWYDPGSSVSVSATANAGYTFSYWLLDGNNAGSSNPITVTMNALHNLTAIFSRASYTLTVYVYRGGSTSGISGVTVKVDGTSYTTDSSGKVSVTVAYGSHTIEVVTPYYQISDTRYIFTQWSDGLTSNPRSISVTSNTTLTAYMKRQYKLTVNVNPSGGGSISASPSSSDWFYDGDSSVTLSVDSSTGFIIRYIFTGWSGDLASSNPTIIIVMDGPKTIIANWRTDYSKLIMFLASIIAAISLSIFYLYYARSKRGKGTIVIDEGGQIIEYLKRLDELYKTGKITKEAYEALKAEYEEKLKNNKKLAHK